MNEVAMELVGDIHSGREMRYGETISVVEWQCGNAVAMERRKYMDKVRCEK